MRALCVGCSKILEYSEVIEISTGQNASFYYCSDCWNKKIQSQSLNTSEVTN